MTGYHSMAKYLFSFLVLLFLVQPVFAQDSDRDLLTELAWLQGRWERVTDNTNRTAFEEWEVQNQMLVGRGVTIQGTDTVFVEKLSILMKDDQLYYVADVNLNTEPTFFKITEYSEKGFISENPDHDFPKKIEYRLSGNGQLTATISGDGQSIPFVFRKQ